MTKATFAPTLEKNTVCWHNDFVAMLPKIQDHARFMFSHLKGDHRDEAVQAVVCNAAWHMPAWWNRAGQRLRPGVVWPSLVSGKSAMAGGWEVR